MSHKSSLTSVPSTLHYYYLHQLLLCRQLPSGSVSIKQFFLLFFLSPQAVRLLHHFVLYGAERCVDHAWDHQRRVSSDGGSRIIGSSYSLENQSIILKYFIVEPVIILPSWGKCPLYNILAAYSAHNALIVVQKLSPPPLSPLHARLRSFAKPEDEYF